MKRIKILYQAVLSFVRTRLSRVQLIMLVAILVGLCSGLVAVLLKTIVHHIQVWLERASLQRYGYLLFPVIGLIITVLIVRYFFGGQLEKAASGGRLRQLAPHSRA